MRTLIPDPVAQTASTWRLHDYDVHDNAAPQDNLTGVWPIGIDKPGRRLVMPKVLAGRRHFVGRITLRSVGYADDETRPVQVAIYEDGTAISITGGLATAPLTPKAWTEVVAEAIPASLNELEFDPPLHVPENHVLAVEWPYGSGATQVQVGWRVEYAVMRPA